MLASLSLGSRGGLTALAVALARAGHGLLLGGPRAPEADSDTPRPAAGRRLRPSHLFKMAMSSGDAPRAPLCLPQSARGPGSDHLGQWGPVISRLTPPTGAVLVTPTPCRQPDWRDPTQLPCRQLTPPAGDTHGRAHTAHWALTRARPAVLKGCECERERVCVTCICKHVSGECKWCDV